MASMTALHFPSFIEAFLIEDPGAVVGQYGRVHGVMGLRVADASIMPTIPRANTNLTCIAIGERVAGWMRTQSDRSGGRAVIPTSAPRSIC